MESRGKKMEIYFRFQQEILSNKENRKRPNNLLFFIVKPNFPNRKNPA